MIVTETLIDVKMGKVTSLALTGESDFGKVGNITLKGFRVRACSEGPDEGWHHRLGVSRKSQNEGKCLL